MNQYTRKMITDFVYDYAHAANVNMISDDSASLIEEQLKEIEGCVHTLRALVSGIPDMDEMHYIDNDEYLADVLKWLVKYDYMYGEKPQYGIDDE